MKQEIRIDLSKVTNKEQLFQIFASHFVFPPHFGNNWDAFFDVMSSLRWAKDIQRPTTKKIDGVHLMLLGFDSLRAQFSATDLDIFLSILVDISPEGDFTHASFTITFEVC